MIAPLIAALAALAAAGPASPHALPGPGHPPARASAPADDEALFLEHCAKCHGEKGDGKGTTELDRPARSFLLGGYSYGNTPAAVLRSVVHGIPGTPMPAFGETLPEADLEALAAYVISLGPPGTVLEPGASVLSVGDRPMVVHGMMPALGEGGRREPRSLIVGFPNGTSFQYRMQTAELVAVRTGDFLDRRDWGGRGGSELLPLGKLSWQPDAQRRDVPAFVMERGAGQTAVPLGRRVKGTAVRGDQVWIDFDLTDDDGHVVGGGQEILSFLMVDDVPVAVRTVLGTSATASVRTQPNVGTPGDALVPDIDVEVAQGETPAPPVHPTYRVSEGLLAVDPLGRTDVRIFIHAGDWSDALRTAVLDSLGKGN